MTLNSFLDQIPDRRCKCCGKFPMQKSMEVGERCRICGKRHRTIMYHCDYCQELYFKDGDHIKNEREKVEFT
jgi:hypothetical protein